MEADGAGSIDICDRMPRPLRAGEVCLDPAQRQEAPATPRVATRIIPTQLPPVPRRARQVDKPAAFGPPPQTRLTRFLDFIENAEKAGLFDNGSKTVERLIVLVAGAGAGAIPFLVMGITEYLVPSLPRGWVLVLSMPVIAWLLPIYGRAFNFGDEAPSQKPATSGLYGEARSANAFEIDAAIRGQGGF